MLSNSALDQTALSTLAYKSIQYRKTILEIVRTANAGHTGGSLSCIDILNVLYNQVMNITPENFHLIERDHYVHSKGHSVEALYTVLADKGFFSTQELLTMEQYSSAFIGHPTRAVPGIEHNTGSLGHGLSFAVGLALSMKLNERSDRVFVTMGDGELTEGSVWEASMSASHYRLDNLVAIVDRNGLQITGPTESVMKLEPLEKKFQAFGWAVCGTNGNNLAALVDVFGKVPFEPGKPNLVLASTVKGKGISFMENIVGWHHRVPTADEFEKAMQELTQQEEAWRKQYGV